MYRCVNFRRLIPASRTISTLVRGTGVTKHTNSQYVRCVSGQGHPSQQQSQSGGQQSGGQQSGGNNADESGFSKYLVPGLSIAGVLAGGLWWLSKPKTTKDKDGKTVVVVPAPEAVEKEIPPPPPEKVPEHAQYLIIGAGTASVGAYRAIKANDAKAKVLLLTQEPHRPYKRPPLSKELWFNDDKQAVENLRYKMWGGKEGSIFYEPPEFYLDPLKLAEMENGGVALLNGIKVIKLDPQNKRAFLNNGAEITFDKCLIATGGRPRNLPAVESAGPDVRRKTTLFRNIEDFQKLDKVLGSCKSVAIVGGGFLGSELAVALANRAKTTKMKVTQVFPEPGNMARVLPEYLSKWTTERMIDDGVTIVPNSIIKSASTRKNQVVLSLDDGSEVCADHIVVAVGLEPNVQLAKTSGLELDPQNGGFRVNAELEARSNIWVAGDASCFYDIKLGRRRVEHHDHAVVSGRLAGENMTGAGKPYWHQSMFWSDLGPNLGYEAIGIVDSSLPTVAVFAKATDKDTPEAVVKETGESMRSETESAAKPSETAATSAPSPTPEAPKLGLEFGKGVVFYLKDKVIVGILLWNVFNKMGVARKVLRDGGEGEDLCEVAKLFNIHEEPDIS